VLVYVLFVFVVLNSIKLIDSYENLNEEEGDGYDDSAELYSQLGAPSANKLRAYYMYGRSLKKGFNAWAGRKRELDSFYKRLYNINKHANDLNHMARERRKPWGGSA
jgi:hypothetical protein